MKIELTEGGLVVLIGASGSGKSTFARTHFRPTEIVSSDFCRGLVDDDENSLDATKDAFEVLHMLVRKRLQRGRMTVVDATNVQPESRLPLIRLANECYVRPAAIVIDTPEDICKERNRSRPDRDFGDHVIRNHCRDLRRSIPALKKEGFRNMAILRPGDEAEIVITRNWPDKRDQLGPFDIVGDVHGCIDELKDLLKALGYPREDRRLVFVGDLTDRGPDSAGVLKVVMELCRQGQAFCVPGNHDEKLLKYLRGKDVKVSHGLAETIDELQRESEEFRGEVRSFIDGLISHLVLDEGRLVVSHAGVREEMQGRGHMRVRDFCLYGETTGEIDEFGLPVRYPWAEEYRGSARVVFGHTPVPDVEWVNRTVCIDTGCVFGGKLTALRYPELEFVSIPARRVYSEPIRPLAPAKPTATDDVLDLADVTGRLSIPTALGGRVTIREQNATAALEVMSRFAADPRWLVYLPPTMSPCRTSERDGYLEYPTEAFDYFSSEGVTEVVCEEKHMGSRAVVVVCRNEDAARKRFRVESGIGAVVTRTGRRFFLPDSSGPDLETSLLERLASAAEKAGLWEELATDWMVLDCELMPWSAKAVELLKKQYASTGAAAIAQTRATVGLLSGASGVDDLKERWQAKQTNAELFVEAYRRYCWPVAGLSDYRLAPFHLLASEGQVHTDQDHLWHMETLARLAAYDELFAATPHLAVDLTDEAAAEAACKWWEERVSAGGEGMVVKSRQFVVRGARGLVQPAIKCRGPEYLRIIYGPDYLEPHNLTRLRRRGLSMKRSLAAREFALGIQALQSFIEHDSFRHVHRCVFGVLALESEPVDPRL